MTTPQDSFVRGFPPRLEHGRGNPEALRYGALWERPEYRAVAPGEVYAELFLEHARPPRGAHVIDFGCGTGRGALRLHEAGLRVTMLDFARNCLDEAVRARLCEGFEFRKHDIETPSPIVAAYGYCTDVMEHVPTERVGIVLDHILRAAQRCFFSIATRADVLGRELLGEPLHLTVRPFSWWRERLEDRGCKILWEANAAGSAFFLVTAWEDAQVVVENGVVNTEVEQIRANVAHNCRQGWQQVIPHVSNEEQEVAILGGGPSLADHELEIRRLKAAGAKLVTLNGAYGWALDRGLGPVTQIVVDARAFNARFVRPVRPECLYLLASQCDPGLFKGLPRERVYLWHATANPIHDILDEVYGSGGWWPVPGGSTVLLRAIPLLRMLGYSKFHLFGADSCLRDGQHHAFLQPENDSDVVVPITVTGGRVFHCFPWMVSQAQEFLGLVRDLGEVLDLCVYGDGLLAHIVRVGAETTIEERRV